MLDRYGRRIHNLRISITDRCNYRCLYCMPARTRFQPSPERLTYDEILRLVRVSLTLGFTDFRVTGGEPLVRPGVLGFLEEFVRTPGVRRVAITTNGHLLGANLEALARAGVRDINLSVDTLRHDRFRAITRGGDPVAVLGALEAAAADPRFRLKINAVVMGGVNDDEVEELAALTLRLPADMRFIEYMPAGYFDAAPPGALVPAAEIERRLEARFGFEDAAGRDGDSGPAEYRTLRGGRGRVGLIRPVSDKFCRDCNRMRLTADGRLKPCLLIERTTDVKEALRSGADDAALAALFGAVTFDKPEKHEGYRLFSMNETGG
jgi:cyclic pyranopterin phosphate synthase